MNIQSEQRFSDTFTNPFSIGGRIMINAVRTAVAGVIVFTGAATVSAATLPINESFDGLPSTGLSSSKTITLISGTSIYSLSNESNTMVRRSGAGTALTNYSLGVGNGVALGANELMSLPATSTFSMTGGIEMPDDNPVVLGNNGGSMGFGWSTAEYAFSPYGGGSTVQDAEVTRYEHVTIGLAKATSGDYGGINAAPTYRLAYGNGVSKNMTTAINDITVELDKEHWYRLDGAVTFMGYDSGTDQSTFSLAASLYDLGANGTLTPALPVLSGTVASYAVTGDFRQAKPIFFANASRGINRLDNLSVVPEPGAMVLMGGAGLLALRRRRRRDARNLPLVRRRRREGDHHRLARRLIAAVGDVLQWHERVGFRVIHRGAAPGDLV
jgi:hypothetical protein